MLTRTLAICCVTTVLVFSVTTFAASKPLLVVSFNMAGESRFDKIVRDFDSAPDIRGADLFLLQEVAGARDNTRSIAKDLAGRLHMQYLFRPADPIGGELMKGLAILSRYPIRDFKLLRLQHNDLYIRSRDRIALAVTVDAPGGAVRVFDLHLDTRINEKRRVEQLQPVLEAADAARMPCLIGGDFNTNSMYWIGHTVPLLFAQDQGQAVRAQMKAHGFSTPFGDQVTFPLFRQKLDWMFVRRLRPVSNGVQQMKFSDHHAIWSRLVRQ